MLNLTKNQINSIVSVISNKAELEREKYENGLRKDPVIKAKVKDIMDTLDKLPNCIEEECGLPDKRDILDALINEAMEKRDNEAEVKNSVDSRRIETRVTLASMKCSTFDELQEILGITI